MSRTVITLRVLSRDHEELVGELVWSNRRLWVVSARAGFRADIERMRTRGLIEWVGTDGESQQRVTPVTDERFLERLQRHLAMQTSSLVALLHVERISEPTAAAPAPAVAVGAVQQLRSRWASYDAGPVMRTSGLTRSHSGSQAICVSR